MVEEVKPPPPHSVSPAPPVDPGIPMEPVLMSCIIDKYVGGTNANGEPEGNGEAFFQGGHKYVGNFAAGRMHGRGKYEWVDRITYIGDFQHNRAQGNGKFIFFDEDAVYEGEVYGGRKQGHGTLSFGNLPTKYTGMWQQGCRHGQGKLSFNEEGTSYYEGSWNMGVREGTGKMMYSSGNYYEGQWSEDNKSGNGTMHWVASEELYTGQWKNGLPNGKGEHIWLKGSHAVSLTIPDAPSNDNTQFQMCNRYKGNFKNGKRQGQGTFLYATGASYQGNWEENVKSGYGAFTFEDGTVYEGAFENDRPVNNEPKSGMVAPTTPVTVSIEDLLEEENDPVRAQTQVGNLLLRYNTELKAVYRYYSALRGNTVPEQGSQTFMMNVAQFWRFVYDCQIISKDFPLARICTILLAAKKNEEGVEFGAFNPKTLLLFREFVEGLVRVAHFQYHDLPTLERRVHHHIQTNILPYASKVALNDFDKELLTPEMMEFRDRHDTALHKMFNYAAGTILTPDSPYTDTVSLYSLLSLLKESGALGEHLSLRAALTALCKGAFPADTAWQEAKGVENAEGELDDEGHDDYHALDSQLIYPEFYAVLCRCAVRWKKKKVLAETDGDEDAAEALTVLDCVTDFMENTLFPGAAPLCDLGEKYMPKPVEEPPAEA